MVYMKYPESALPPGFRFHPTDEELILHYLKKKVASAPFPVSIIADVDIYKFDPWDLPAKAAFGEKEWYFFSPRDRKYPNGARPNRAAASGYWKATGTDKIILASSKGGGGGGGQEKNIGVKKALVFYEGRPPKGVKTNWIMHEYRLADSPTNFNHTTNTKPIIMRSKDSSMRLDDWVLCRIYRKSHVSLPASAAAVGDHDQEEEEEDRFFQDTILPILKSPRIHNTLNSQKSSSFSNLLDAMDYSMLSNFLSETTQTNHIGLESNHLFTPGTLDHQNPSFNNGNGTHTNTTNGFLIQKLPQLNYSSVPNSMENNKLKRSLPNIDNNEQRPSKKFIPSSCIFTNSTATDDKSDTQCNFLHQSFLNQQLQQLSPHFNFQG